MIFACDGLLYVKGDKDELEGELISLMNAFHKKKIVNEKDLHLMAEVASLDQEEVNKRLSEIEDVIHEISQRKGYSKGNSNSGDDDIDGIFNFLMEEE